MIVDTLLGVPIDGGMLTCGRVGWILLVIKLPLTNALRNDQALVSF